MADKYLISDTDGFYHFTEQLARRKDMRTVDHAGLCRHLKSIGLTSHPLMKKPRGRAAKTPESSVEEDLDLDIEAMVERDAANIPEPD